MKSRIIAALCLLCAYSALAQPGPPYKNSQLPIETRVQDLLSRMRPEEKFWQLFMIPGDLGRDSTRFANGLFGFQVNTIQEQQGASAQILQYGSGGTARQTLDKINSIQRYFVEQTRLGIPIIAFDEALHGLVRAEATAFPQSIALAASWDTLLMRDVATSIALETRARGIRHILSPVLNLATDPRWGRTEETYGEDPTLAAAMGLAFVGAFERQGIITNPKHFAVNHGDGGRDSYPIHANERLLEETYFVPFKAAIQQGGAGSIMTAYNSLDGAPCTANSWLLNEKLRKQWGFNGFVLSDAGATGGANVLHFTAADYADAGKRSIENGLDVMFQTDYEHYKLFIPPFLDGRLSPAVIDSAVARVLRAKFRLGLFENPYVDSSWLRSWLPEDHRTLARKAAERSMVLLKNERPKGWNRPVLPLTHNLRSIALIGTDAAEARLGGYSGPGNSKISMRDGLIRRLHPGQRLNYVPGPGRELRRWTIVPSSVLQHRDGNQRKPGLKAAYYNNTSLSGKPALERIDPQLAFQWTLFSPDPEKINYDFFSARWTGELVAPETGRFNLGIDGNDGYRVYIDDKLVIDHWRKQTYETHMVPVDLVKGRSYALRVEYQEPSGNAWFRLIWDLGVKDLSATHIADAVRIARESDVAIIVAGIEEGEFRDRASLALPGAQEELIRAVAATGKPLVVVLVGGSAITMSAWYAQAAGILMAWYPGEMGGAALADILFGYANPSGKLPITFPLSEAQLPLVYNHKPTGRGDDYLNLSGKPLYPFGFGLSYTEFQYSDLQLSSQRLRIGDTLEVSCRIQNTGQRAGEEVVQLYLHDELASVARPVKELKDFQRVSLQPGESRLVRFRIHPGMLRMLDAQLKEVIEPGSFRMMIGTSSADTRLRAVFTVE